MERCLRAGGALLLGTCLGASLDPVHGADAWFEDVTRRSGIEFVHDSGATGRFLLPEIMGAGAGLFDYDGDGDLDLYLTSGGANRLYRQKRGGRFEDVTEAAGVGDTGYGMGVAVGDYDNDGDRDLYVTNHGPDRLYRNRGDGSFEDVTDQAGVAVSGWSSSATFVDYDRDGFLDLFVVRYVDYDPKKKCTDAAGRIDYCSPKVFPPQVDVLLRNAGDETFTDVTARSGIARGIGAGLGVAVLDADSDGRLDLFVANDGYANHLWRNRGDGTFHDIALLSGVAYNLHGAPEAGMGVVAADLDNDLRPDLFLTHLANETNTFYRNLGDKNFEDRSGPSGLAGSSLPYTGFGTAAFDVELDGDLDLVVANGRVTRGRARSAADGAAPWSAFAEPNVLYLNDGEGVFKGDPERGKTFATPVEISRAVAVGDIDADGDLDLVVANVESAARIYRNRAERAGRWLTVRAVDPRYGRDAIGAEITVVGKGWRRVGRVSPGSGYLSSHDPRVHFGLGKVATVERVEIRWPDGMTESFAVPRLDRHLTLARGASESEL